MNELKPLTDRRCEECDLYMFIEDRTTGGMTWFECALGHFVIVAASGQEYSKAKERSQ